MNFSRKNFNTQVMKKNIYGIEQFEYIDKHVYITGWFRMLYNDDDFKLIAINNKQKKELPVGLIDREDIEYRLKERGRIIGFESNSFMPIYSNMQFYLIYRKERILLYNFKISKLQVISEWAKKINLRNMKTFINAVISGNALSLMKDVTGNGNAYAVPSEQKMGKEKSADDKVVFADVDIEWKKHNADIIVIVNDSEQMEELKSFLGKIKRTEAQYSLTGMIDLKNQAADELKNLFQVTRYYRDMSELTRIVKKELFLKRGYVVVMDSNVIVPEYWLERLIMPFLYKDNAAVAAPFINLIGTNNFFDTMSNKLYEKGYLQEFDHDFGEVKPIYKKIPNVNPACFSLNMKHVRKREQDFEEYIYLEHMISELCYGVLNDGMDVVQIENLYVHYRRKYEIRSRKDYVLDIRKLEKRCPEYNERLFTYWSGQDNKIEMGIMINILAKALKGKTNLIFNHMLGGGAEEYIRDKIVRERALGNNNIIIRYDQKKERYKLELYMYECSETMHMKTLEDIERLFSYLDIEQIYINELFGYNDLYMVMKKITDWKKEYNVKLIMLFHDYYPICPTINLLDYKGNYCRTFNLEKCQRCFEKLTPLQIRGIEDIGEWRANWEEFLKKCNRIIVFSESTKKYIQLAYPAIDNMEIIRHQVDYVRKVNKHIKRGNTIRIGLLGRLTGHKGAFIVKEMCDLIQKRSYDVRMVLNGDVDTGILEDIKSEPLYIMGKYQKEELPDLIERQKIDIIFISSIWPETFSYTTEEAIKMEVPVACFNIGAPPERVKNYEKGLVIENVDAEEALEKIVDFVLSLEK